MADRNSTPAAHPDNVTLPFIIPCPECGEPLVFYDGTGEEEWYCIDCCRIAMEAEKAKGRLPSAS